MSAFLHRTVLLLLLLTHIPRNIAANETQGVKHAVYERYPTRLAALKVFDDAQAAGMVNVIRI